MLYKWDYQNLFFLLFYGLHRSRDPNMWLKYLKKITPWKLKYFFKMFLIVLETDNGRRLRLCDGEAVLLRPADHLRPHQRVLAADQVAIGQLRQTGIGAAKRRRIFDRLRRLVFRNEALIGDRKRLLCSTHFIGSRFRVGQLSAQASSPRTLWPSPGVELLFFAAKNELDGSDGFRRKFSPEIRFDGSRDQSTKRRFSDSVRSIHFVVDESAIWFSESCRLKQKDIFF
jgi:hypothetical protein